MRKLISLLLAVVMVMGMATVAFAATDAGDHLVSDPADIPTSVTLDAGEMAVYTIEGGSEAAKAIFGKFLYLTSENKAGMYMYNPYYGAELADYNNYTVEVEMWEPWQNGYNIAIQNNGTETATYGLEFKATPGTVGNPDTRFDAYGNNYPYMQEVHEGEYYYSYTAGDVAEVLTIKDIVVTYNVTKMENLNYNILMTRDDNVEVSLWSEEGYAEEIYMPLAAGQSVIITVRAQELEPTGMNPSVNFAASVGYVTEVSMAGDYQVQDAEAWYAVNSMLAGYIIAVNGDEASVMVDGTVVNAVEGVATAVLTGEGATILVKVSNATDMIILPAPTEINAAGDYKATVGAGAEVEYAINSKLAGAVLTVKGEGAYIYMGGTKYDAVNGVASATLDGTGATIAVKIGNAGNASAEYELNIAYPPVVIAAHGEYKASVAAGAEVEYVVNSKLDGAYVTVKGEGAYLVVDGKKVEGKDGVVSTVLAAKGATISLKVGNAGTAAAEYTVVVSANPPTGDFGVIAAAVALAVSAMGGVAVVAKKKEN